MYPPRPDQSGNILFLILLAVVLFAALAYAVTQSMRGGGKTATPEKISAAIAQVNQHATAIENFVMRAMMMNNVPEYGFEFVGENTTSTASNNTCTSDNCRILKSVDSLALPVELRDPATVVSKESLRAAIVLNIGTSAPDLMLLYRYLNKEACEAINKLYLGSPTMPNEGWGTAIGYGGTLTSFPAATGVIGDDSPLLVGQKTACFYHSSDGYSFYHVILER